MNRAVLVGLLTIVGLFGCVSSNHGPSGTLIRPCSGCRYRYVGRCRFVIEARGGRWSSYPKPGWSQGPTLEDIALVGAAELARRYHQSSFEILEQRRTHVWWLGFLGSGRTALHRLVIRLTGPPGGEEVEPILETLGPEVGYEPFR